jgi:hypothetical protein
LQLTSGPRRCCPTSREIARSAPQVILALGILVIPAKQLSALGRHSDKAARAKLLYLPKYSPDLNPIEQAFSKLKAHLRKAAERTIPRLCRRIGVLMTAFSSQECANYFSHAGYAST